MARLAGDPDGLRDAVDGALDEEQRVEELLADLLLLASVDEAVARSADPVDLAAIVTDEAARPRGPRRRGRGDRPDGGPR